MSYWCVETLLSHSHVSSSGYRLSDFLCVPLTEGGHLPAGLRGFRRHPSQRGQWKADIHLSSSLSPTLKPAGTAAPNCHPGKDVNINIRQRAPSTHSRFTDSLIPFSFSCCRNLVLRTQSTFLLMVTTIGYWPRSGFAAPTSSAISWPPIFWGLTWWLSCAAGPRCGTSRRRIHCTRFTTFRLPTPCYSYPLSLQIFFFLLYIFGVHFWTAVDASRQDFTTDQPSSSSLHVGSWWCVW